MQDPTSHCNCYDRCVANDAEEKFIVESVFEVSIYVLLALSLVILRLQYTYCFCESLFTRYCLSIAL